jgi:hypothetical protein
MQYEKGTSLMHYKPIDCSQEQLFPTQWICGNCPDRDTIAKHVRSLRSRYGNETARECIRRMFWIGIIPSNRNRWR